MSSPAASRLLLRRRVGRGERSRHPVTSNAATDGGILGTLRAVDGTEYHSLTVQRRDITTALQSLKAANLRIECIVSTGQSSPDGFWFDQDHNEWVIMLRGTARLRFEPDEVIELRPGSYVNIPAHKRHRVEWTDPTAPTVWLALHYAGD